MPEIQFVILLDIWLDGTNLMQFGVYERVGETYRTTAHVAQSDTDGTITAVVLEV